MSFETVNLRITRRSIVQRFVLVHDLVVENCWTNGHRINEWSFDNHNGQSSDSNIFLSSSNDSAIFWYIDWFGEEAGSHVTNKRNIVWIFWCGWKLDTMNGFIVTIIQVGWIGWSCPRISIRNRSVCLLLLRHKIHSTILGCFISSLLRPGSSQKIVNCVSSKIRTQVQWNGRKLSSSTPAKKENCIIVRNLQNLSQSRFCVLNDLLKRFRPMAQFWTFFKFLVS